MARSVKRAARLASGMYSWRGRAVPFGRLPEAHQHAWRVEWGKRGARAQKATRKARAAEYLFAETTPPPDVIRRRYWRYFAVDRLPGSDIRRVTKALIDETRVAVEGFRSKAGCFFADVDWPQDKQAYIKGRPLRTGVNLPKSYLTPEYFEFAVDFMEALEVDPAILGRRGDAHPSRGRGKPTIVRITLMVGPHRKKRRAKKRPKVDLSDVPF
jgi:hypothetical protein